ncbi:MAG: phosphoribosylglycinamide formyltransferase [Proteobacteria bacterium]|nr:MAG: phosphoribosylglycinamide formyltransferase [Pseudomonadota bacterium]
MPVKNKRIVVLISGSGSNLQSIIDACQTGQIQGKIVAVISNRPNAYGLERAQQAGIQVMVIDHKHYEERDSFDHALQSYIDEQQADLVVLAGFMRILTENFVQHYHGKMLNIHPSLLPAYKGTHTHQRVLDDGGTKHGASVHFVTPELDGGPVVLQASVPILTDDTAETLAKRVLQQEHQIYPKVVEWFCAERLVLRDGLPHLDGKILRRPDYYSQRHS